MAKTDQMNKLHLLENVELQIAKCLEFAGLSLTELAKDKSNAKVTESNTSQFLKSLETIESELSAQINYLTTVSTGQPHEGSCYGAQKDLQMAHHRAEHVKSRLGELDQLRPEHRRQLQQLSYETLGGGGAVPPGWGVVAPAGVGGGVAQRSLIFSDPSVS